MTRALTCLSLGAISVLLASSTAAGSSGRSSTIDEPIHKACAAVEVRGLVQRFVTSFIRGDLPRLGAVFQQERGFEWYSTHGTGERLRARATHRRSLVTYFVARHRRGEGLEVTRFRFNGPNGVAYGNFEFTLVRRASDLDPARYDGKGATRCFSNAPDVIFVWSMGRA